MADLIYRILIFLSKKYGLWIFVFGSRIIATGYFLFFPKKLLIGIHFYQALFPDKRRLFHILSVWKQFINFTHVFLDRFILEDSGNIQYDSQGLEYLDNAMKNQTGGIILMSHMGNWEVAAHLLKERGFDLLLYMGAKHKEQIERIQKESLSKNKINIISVDRKGGSPFIIVEGLRFLKNGGFVSLTGDRVWNTKQRKLTVSFLSHTIHLPEIPFRLSLISGVPIFIFFSFRTGLNKYYFTITPPMWIQAGRRADRENNLKMAAQAYADLLETMLRHHPYEWYHFDSFLGPKDSNHM